MGIFKEVRAFIAEERAKNNYISLLERQIDILNKDRQILLDRLMAVDYTRFKMYRDADEGIPTMNSPLDLLGDEGLAGSVLEDETESEESG